MESVVSGTHARPDRIWTGYLKNNRVFCCCFYCGSYTVLLPAYCHRSIPNCWNCRPPIIPLLLVFTGTKSTQMQGSILDYQFKYACHHFRLNQLEPTCIMILKLPMVKRESLLLLHLMLNFMCEELTVPYQTLIKNLKLVPLFKTNTCSNIYIIS